MTVFLRSADAFRSFVTLAAEVTNVIAPVTGGIFTIRTGYGIIQSADDT